MVAAAIALFFKELRLVSFDPVFAQVSGLSPRLVGGLVTALAALAAVVSLEAVGVILVVAMMVCPAAAARHADRRSAHPGRCSPPRSPLPAASLGYLVAAFGPSLFGYDISLGAAATIALVAGLFQLGAMIFGPKRGRPRTA